MERAATSGRVIPYLAAFTVGVTFAAAVFVEVFSPNSFDSFGDALWWAAQTVTTVGYGDKTPKTFLGKMVSLIWMFAAIIMISFFTASITSTLTVNSLEMQIETLKDLKKFKTIGTVHASGSDYFLKNNNMQDLVRIKKYWTPDDGLKALGKGHIGAFIYDEPILKFLESHNDYGEELQVLTHLFNKQYYGFIMPKGSPLLDKINPVLIEKIKDRRAHV